MFRILFYLIIVFLLGLGFAWLAERPGDLVLTFGGYRYEVSLMVAAVAVAAIVATVMILWWLVRSLWNSPYAVARYFRVRRRDRGYQALSTGMIAAGAGDGGLARRMGRQASKLIDSDREPLLHLLDAQAALLEGDHDTARKRFEAMLDDPEMRLLGLRGLYIEAERLGDRSAAHHYADRAAEIAPQLGWAVNATMEARTEQGDWDGALKLVGAQKASGQADRAAAARKRAVLLTAKAMADADTDPAAARVAALEANRLQPEFIPAALIAAKLLFRQDELRKGSKILETVWKKEPHPEVADLYVHARSGDAALDRLARARKLQSLRPNNAESELAVARAALDAGEYQLARVAAEAAIRISPREGAYLLLADIEEAETGDQGRVRQWLAKAVRAPQDPAWVADGHVSDKWAPCSPVTGRLDAFEWRVPMERLGQVVEADEDFATAPGKTVALPAIREENKPDIVEVEEATSGKPQATTQKPPMTKASNGADKGPAAPSESETDASSGMDGAADAEPAMSEPAPKPADRREAAPEPPRPPDDPGVDEEEKPEETERRFRLF
ncbi:HemY protein [Mesorhizobium sp. J18]|uniref:heme biosynthesis protein HemY n=1 Tax=Mesorhizobium sp. J18 TaxID=935263 RepID=UPI00119A44DA|nr:heme biosynthesis protein HemY [Mesorhizobium sp. J18]TWG97994.1 HemY protein [Mesorhizobium sp. J18]